MNGLAGPVAVWGCAGSLMFPKHFHWYFCEGLFSRVHSLRPLLALSADGAGRRLGSCLLLERKAGVI